MCTSIQMAHCHTRRSDQGPAWALGVSIEDCDGQFTLLGFLASHLKCSGSLLQTNLEADSTLAEFAGIIYAR